MEEGQFEEEGTVYWLAYMTNGGLLW